METLFLAYTSYLFCGNGPTKWLTLVLTRKIQSMNRFGTKFFGETTVTCSVLKRFKIVYVVRRRTRYKLEVYIKVNIFEIPYCELFLIL